MRILMPILHYPPVIGGFEVFSQSIAERIGKAEDVFVVTSKVVNTPRIEEKDKLRIFRTSLFTLKDLSYSKPFYIATAMIWIAVKSFKLIKKERIELIHAQGFLSGIIAWFLNKLTKIPYILTIQSADFSVYHPRLNINIIKWAYRKFEKAVFEKTTIGHAVSNYLGDYLKQKNVKRIVVVPNGVSVEKFKPDRNKLETRKKFGFDAENLIVCVSRLEHKNGTHDLIKAAGFLKDVDFKIIICGDGSERERLERMVKSLKLENRIFFLGDILHADLPKYVAMGDIFVRPSLAEGFGIVFLEAMAAELAVVATPVGGITDFLEDSLNGLFCKPGNPKDLAEKIDLLIRNQNLRKNLIQNGKKMVEEVYNWDKISEQIKEIYKEI